MTGSFLSALLVMLGFVVLAGFLLLLRHIGFGENDGLVLPGHLLLSREEGDVVSWQALAAFEDGIVVVVAKMVVFIKPHLCSGVGLADEHDVVVEIDEPARKGM